MGTLNNDCILSLRVLHLNVRAIQHKRNQISKLLQDENPHIAIITEHWLCPVEITCYNLGGYEIKSYYARKNGYGGVLILANKNIKEYVSSIDVIK